MVNTHRALRVAAQLPFPMALAFLLLVQLVMLVLVDGLFSRIVV